MKNELLCPHCGKVVEKYRNPIPAVDIIIEWIPAASGNVIQTVNLKERKHPQRGNDGIILIKRKNPPLGWALPGGFVDYGESLEAAAVREAEEETSLNVNLQYQLGAYSDPSRDPRFHTISVVFVARATGAPKAADDAVDFGIFSADSLPADLAFDHGKILQDYFERFSQFSH
jgi:ADP-ribose pyrophosphatase YjhB (NUDIX family)